MSSAKKINSITDFLNNPVSEHFEASRNKNAEHVGQITIPILEKLPLHRSFRQAHPFQKPNLNKVVDHKVPNQFEQNWAFLKTQQKIAREKDMANRVEGREKWEAHTQKDALQLQLFYRDVRNEMSLEKVDAQHFIRVLMNLMLRYLTIEQRKTFAEAKYAEKEAKLKTNERYLLNPWAAFDNAKLNVDEKYILASESTELALLAKHFSINIPPKNLDPPEKTPAPISIYESKNLAESLLQYFMSKKPDQMEFDISEMHNLLAANQSASNVVSFYSAIANNKGEVQATTYNPPQNGNQTVSPQHVESVVQSFAKKV